MKNRLLVLAAAYLLTGTHAFAGNGDLIVNGNVGVGTTSPAAKLQVNGEVMAGNSGLACSSSTAGALRYNSSSYAYEFCNSIVWQRLVPRVNVAAKANGGSASASSTNSANYPVQAVNDGDRKGINCGAGGVWVDGTQNVFPDWVQITFSELKFISEIDVFNIQDNVSSPVDPTPTLTFTKYGSTAFDVQYWNGTAWVTLPGGHFTNNNLVWNKITFPLVQTDKIRVLISASADGVWSRVTEIEAY